MPPKLYGSLFAVEDPLEVLRRLQRHDRRAVAQANNETSGPSRYSSTITSPHVAACSSAAARSDVTMTPLPAASPSSFTTYGGPNASRATATSSGVRQRRASAVGTPAAVMTSFAKAFEPSSWAAAADGPKQVTPTAVTKSATPATSGASGPTTTRSAPISSASAATASPDIGSTSWRVATAAMPGLPGAMCTSSTPGSRDSARARACSRPPVPITSVFTTRQSREPG